MKNRRIVTISALSLVVAGTLVLSGCGAAVVENAASTSTTATTTVASSSTDFWDSSTVHTIDVDVDADTLAGLLETYETSGEKEWVEVDVTIDGVTYVDAGLKLKGNSSLRGVSSDEDASTIPWIIRLDKFVDGQAYQGITEFVVRGNSSQTSLNEAVALDLLDLSGLAAEQAAATRFTIGGSTSLRLVVENPSDSWNDATIQATALYKAESGGDYSYRGTDPDAYDGVFDQEAGGDDLTPLISFLQFINESDDATFGAELSQHLDVDAFATYLAFQELVDNFDDIDGPGNNSYLAYDADTGLMTVVNWDLNLAFGASPTAGDTTAGGGGAGGGQLPANGGADAAPGGARGGAGGGAGGGGAGGGGAAGGSNILAERFLENDEFSALYESELARLTQLFYQDGNATEILSEWSNALKNGASDLVGSDTINAEAEDLATAFDDVSSGSTSG